MDRRNGGDSLAPPRPPKSLPRVHRPRAPEPPMMSASNLNNTNSSTTTTTTTTAAEAATTILHPCHIPQQLSSKQPQSPEQQHQQHQLQSHNQICTNNHIIQQNRNNNNNIISNNINSNLNRTINSGNSNIVNSNTDSNNINHINNNNNNNNNINSNTITVQRAPLTAPLIPLHNSINSNSNTSNISNLASTTTNTSTHLASSNSFTRRRPQTPIIGLQILPPPTTPLLSSSNLILQNINNNNNDSSPSISPVTLAAPRPENERLCNEYVDTPLRNATTQNLHHVTRIQHPAGQTIRGQTTTSHNLLHSQRQHLQSHNHHHNHHQQPQHHQIHFNSTTTTTSHSSNINNNHNNNNNNNNNNISSSSNNERHRQTSNVPSSISTVGGGSAGGSSGTLRQVISSGVCGIDGSSNTLHSNNISHKNIISKSIIGTTCVGSAATPTTLSSTASSTIHSATSANNQRILPGNVVRQSHQQQQQPQHQQHQQHQSTIHHSATILPITEPITKQPASFSKDCLSASILHEELDLHHLGSNSTLTGSLTAGGASGSGNSTNNSDYLNSITCPQCKKCRCEQCQSPRQLPSKWVCNKTCLCSAETVIDYASCLCCVKALFYHCSKDHEMECDDGTDSISCADDPCSCLPHKRATRWGWLGALSVALPCLWCYWPMQGCIAVCAKCYARHARHGCRCNNYQSQIGSTSSMLPIAPAHGNQITTTKSSGIIGSNVGGGICDRSLAGGVSGINSNSSHHHHHHNHHCNNGGVSRIRTNDLTPEKRLLDSSPEY